MAEEAKRKAVDAGRHRIPEPEVLDVELANLLRRWLGKQVETGRRQFAGEKIPANAKIVIEYGKELRALGRIYLDAAERGDAARLLAFVDGHFMTNYQDPETGETALHILAANGARRALRALMSTGRLSYLHRDRQGRLPSELAYLHGDDPAMARLLAIKEKEGARKLQLKKLTRRPGPDAP